MALVYGRGYEFYWTSRRGSDRVGASRSRSAACAADTALSTSSLRSFGFPRSTPRRANTVTAPPRLAASLIPSSLARLVFVGFVALAFARRKILQGCYSWPPTGAAMNSVRDLHAKGLASEMNRRSLELRFRYTQR